jgi:uncharacterized protein (UPF0335 family)
MKEITDEKLAEIRSAACSPLVQALVARLDRVEEELKERVERMEEALQGISKTCGDPFCTCCGHDLCIAQAALKEGE